MIIKIFQHKLRLFWKNADKDIKLKLVKNAKQKLVRKACEHKFVGENTIRVLQLITPEINEQYLEVEELFALFKRILET
eukprot:UN03905